MYRLKANQPPFEVVDGPAAGQKFAHGFVYTDLPAGEQARFERIEEAAPTAPADPPAKKAAKKTGEEVADA